MSEIGSEGGIEVDWNHFGLDYSVSPRCVEIILTIVFAL